MGLFNGIIGNASQHNNESIEKELQGVLVTNENVDLAFKLVRDLIVFTDKRLIIVDKQGVTGKKIEYKSLPYKSISRFSVETSGHFDLDAELKIWISSSELPAEILQFRKDKNIVAIQQALATAILS
ncbi:TPA: PH domain-containing protein [Enterococcus faecalis]|uniref:PH domain-containing protein n=1 Tax=Enterococcus faecalis TaxID=1351 RepID=A0AAW7K4L4_ENTFL|nr:PH domain-containing protein [Enterococcus faecalis]EGO8493414.1 PH domain-containing protein [Enterococcus faecalis]MBD9843858.1 PH domain-containing protein [Enterococcus faecalis]MDN3072169.1 PH domain-containing protein [Enterococcus faecalis]MDN3093772.1 PH domain-containing protein [Enterococcus faecalis]MDN3190995.1 PH domain-containing protein [Enterococcus faecalis]